jgi:NADH-quinone oxidoreductase subunit A
MSPIAIAAYVVLFAGVAFAFVFASLLLGRFLRPRVPSPQKLEAYECGEPAIGSSFVQFDLRFYVVALVFILFEVEVAFFFPWAAVYGKVTRLLAPNAAAETTAATYRELGIPEHAVMASPGRQPGDDVGSSGEPSPGLRPGLANTSDEAAQPAAPPVRSLALAAMIDIGVFFAVLLVGFAYVWNRGDLDWVRAVARPASAGGKEPGAP